MLYEYAEGGFSVNPTGSLQHFPDPLAQTSWFRGLHGRKM